MTTKRCSMCKETKPVSEFGKDRSRGDGLSYKCRKCVREKSRRYYETNKEKIAEAGRRRYEANRDKVSEQHRRYREANKEKIAEYQRRYREGNKEKLYERGRRCREINREQVRRRNKEYRKEINNRSLELAHRQGLPWEDWEYEFIMVDNGLTIYQKAVKLGRSYTSVKIQRHRIRKSARTELTTDTVRV
ncbi:hypothetical protein [Corynebacterium guaraldiae]|uniref:hypothetical protein n=1 Tax=Corynebacterium guaraldiae TaxID=3051103 RepID=UPI001177DE70|nr:hypothetical protein [Corynebacterium guaraldiae]TRX43725.1 hypothetical protein FNY89_01070 [Corynebacterium guaraldiae]